MVKNIIQCSSAVTECPSGALHTECALTGLDLESYTMMGRARSSGKAIAKNPLNLVGADFAFSHRVEAFRVANVGMGVRAVLRCLGDDSTSITSSLAAGSLSEMVSSK